MLQFLKKFIEQKRHRNKEKFFLLSLRERSCSRDIVLQQQHNSHCFIRIQNILESTILRNILFISSPKNQLMRKENKHQAFENICRLTGKTRPQVNGPQTNVFYFFWSAGCQFSIWSAPLTNLLLVTTGTFNGTFRTFLLLRISAENISDIIQRNH